MKICICGGGSQGHVCSGYMAQKDDVTVNVLTRHPESWNEYIEVNDSDGTVQKGKLNIVSSSPEEVVKGCDIILLCLPGYAIEETLRSIKPFIGDAIVGSVVSSTGFFFFAHEILGKTAKLFGFQRVPFIARTKEYGSSVSLMGHKNNLSVAVENVDSSENFRNLMEYLLDTPTSLCESYYEVALTNSNPILHTGRLYSLWKEWHGETYDHLILFYQEWTDEASSMLIDMDHEFFRLLDVLGVREGAIPTLLEYYESNDAPSLTKKIRSIEAFKNIAAPMIETDNGWLPDFTSRYFTEDFPYGLKFIKSIAAQNGVDTPVIDKVLNWGLSVCASH